MNATVDNVKNRLQEMRNGVSLQLLDAPIASEYLVEIDTPESDMARGKLQRAVRSLRSAAQDIQLALDWLGR